MTREEKLWSMTARTLQEVGEKAGVKITNSDIKKGKAVIIEKILKAEADQSKEMLKEKMQARRELRNECPEISEEEMNEIQQAMDDFAGDGTPLNEVGKEIAEQAKQKSKLVPMPGIEDPDWGKKHVESFDKPERKRGALIEYNGKAQNICAWAKELGVSANTLYSRIYILGWDVEKAFTHKGKKS